MRMNNFIKRLLLVLILANLLGCSSSDFANKKNSSVGDAVIYSAIALIKGEVIDGDCEHGHPEDQITCKKKQKENSKKN